ASAGESVSEQKQEIAVATAMVMANCWKNCPEIPPRNAVGTNTAHSTSAMETSAPPTSSMVRSAASRRLMPSRRWRSTFSTTTMASSTTMPTASTRPNRVRLLIAKPSAAIAAKVPTRETGIATMGMMAGAPSLQEHQHDNDPEDHRLVDRLDQFADGLRDEFGRIIPDIVVETFREIGLEPDHGIGNVLRGSQRVRAGALGHQHR